MKRLKLFTEKYEDEMWNFSTNAAMQGIVLIKSKKKSQRGFSVTLMVAKIENFYELLTSQLMDIAENENPVYRHSPKLRGMAKNLRNVLYEQEIQKLSEFLLHSKEINLEGYVMFRMTEFKEKLDMMIYSLVKKLKYGNLD